MNSLQKFRDIPSVQIVRDKVSEFLHNIEIGKDRLSDQVNDIMKTY